MNSPTIITESAIYMAPKLKIHEIQPRKGLCVTSYGEEGKAGAVTEIINEEEEF